MAIQKRIWKDEAGNPVLNDRGEMQYEHVATADAGYEQVHVLRTGSVQGPVVLSDGTEYDVTPDYIELKTLDHVGPINHHIAMKHEARALDPRDENPPLANDFRHVCTDDCGAEAIANRRVVEVAP